MFKDIPLFMLTLLLTSPTITLAGTSKPVLPQTGQTTSIVYGGKDDGAQQNGAVWPNPRFSDNGNGTVTDNLTNLTWLKNANCFGTKNWPNALTSANMLASGACALSDGSIVGDWRLPNSTEIESLLDLSKYSPALPTGHPFSAVQSDNYWSSTASAYNSNYFWYINMSDGNVGNNVYSSIYYVWPVRGGQ
jgi:hypothetical protein